MTCKLLLPPLPRHPGGGHLRGQAKRSSTSPALPASLGSSPGWEREPSTRVGKLLPLLGVPDGPPCSRSQSPVPSAASPPCGGQPSTSPQAVHRRVQTPESWDPPGFPAPEPFFAPAGCFPSFGAVSFILPTQPLLLPPSLCRLPGPPSLPETPSRPQRWRK